MTTNDLSGVFGKTTTDLPCAVPSPDVEHRAPHKGFVNFEPLPSGALSVLGASSSPSSTPIADASPSPPTCASTPSTDSSSRKRGRPPKAKPKSIDAIKASRLFKLKPRKPGRPSKTHWLRQWRDLSDKTKLERHVEAILATGNGKALTLILGDKQLSKIMTKPDHLKLDGIVPNFMKALERRLGRKPLAVFVGHYNAAGRWHVHSMMDLGLDDLPAVLEAAQEACGEKPKLARGKRQFDIRPAYSASWGGYMFREAPGKSIRTTPETTRAAKAYHEQERDVSSTAR